MAKPAHHCENIGKSNSGGPKRSSLHHLLALGLTDEWKRDRSHFSIPRSIGLNIRPRATLGDNSYSGNANSHQHALPTRACYNFYQARARIERIFSKFERFKRVALRCEKTQQS